MKLANDIIINYKKCNNNRIQSTFKIRHVPANSNYFPPINLFSNKSR